MRVRRKAPLLPPEWPPWSPWNLRPEAVRAHSSPSPALCSEAPPPSPPRISPPSRILHPALTFPPTSPWPPDQTHTLPMPFNFPSDSPLIFSLPPGGRLRDAAAGFLAREPGLVSSLPWRFPVAQRGTGAVRELWLLQGLAETRRRKEKLILSLPSVAWCPVSTVLSPAAR